LQREKIEVIILKGEGRKEEIRQKEEENRQREKGIQKM